jgi:predicted RNase H-like nuclease
MNVLGVDGCKYGWVALHLEENLKWQVKLYSEISELLEDYQLCDVILIDMPIGLLEGSTNGRLCDQSIRKELGYPRGMSVFGIPTRQAIYCNNYKEANAVNNPHLNA